MNNDYKSNTFSKRIKSMLKVDFRRAFTTKLFYIMTGMAVVIPILILVMTSMLDGTVSVNSTTGEETVMQGFTNVWQIIGSVSGGSQSAMSMDLVSMCNINLMYFMIVIFTCLFVGEDFRSGYVKNLFAIRAKKADYVVSKTLVCFIACAFMIIGFFIGSLLGGAIAGLPFTMQGFNAGNLILCLLSKIFLTSAFVAIYALMSIIAKQRLWLSILLSFGVGMFMFNIIPFVSPLNASFLNLLFSIVGGAGLSVGMGAISNLLLNKRDIL